MYATYHRLKPRGQRGDVHWRDSAMPASKKFLVSAQWDEEANVWVATSDDIPGLATEVTAT
ncbi:DUF1902 domain-containing protein [Mesorhizobium sp.]|uniref:DUF1902 domain-containing protein n=1 Tax=Mesorhizobium sp. TaxID=1871066 RepID=UPI00338E570E